MYAADFGDRVEELYLGNCAALSPDTKSMPFTMPYGCAKVLGPKDPKIKAEIGGPETACLQQACLVHRLVVHWSPLVLVSTSSGNKFKSGEERLLDSLEPCPGSSDCANDYRPAVAKP